MNPSKRAVRSRVVILSLTAVKNIVVLSLRGFRVVLRTPTPREFPQVRIVADTGKKANLFFRRIEHFEGTEPGEVPHVPSRKMLYSFGSQ